MPFIAEEIYQNLKTDAMPESVHLCDFPNINYTRDLYLEMKMSMTQQAIALGRGIRNLHQLKTRQPLSVMYLVTKDVQARQVLQEMESIIKEELNVKEVVFRQNEEDLVSYQVKANYRVLGKKLGKDMKSAAQIVEKFDTEQN